MMRTCTFVTALATLACVGWLASCADLVVQQGVTVSIDEDDIAGIVTGPNGPEAGVWVIRRNARPPDEVRAERRDRRRGQIRRARSSGRRLRRVGPRLRISRFAEDHHVARKSGEPDGGSRRRTRQRRPSTTRLATG